MFKDSGCPGLESPNSYRGPWCQGEEQQCYTSYTHFPSSAPSDAPSNSPVVPTDAPNKKSKAMTPKKPKAMKPKKPKAMKPKKPKAMKPKKPKANKPKNKKQKTTSAPVEATPAPISGPVGRPPTRVPINCDDD